MESPELIQHLNKQFQTELPQLISQDQLLQKLSELINHLVQTDFEKLIFLLYKIDIDEAKLKEFLKQNQDSDASPFIAELITERERQKIYTRSQFSSKGDIEDEEKW